MTRVRVLALGVSAALVLSAAARAADESLATALAAAAAKLVAEGRTEKAKELCYKALANHEDCSEALYELGKLFEKDGQAALAASFLVRASRLFARQEAANPEFASKRADAERRIRALNPYALRLAALMTEYAQDLGAIVKKSPDSLTIEDALDRLRTLRLADLVPPEKLPAFDQPAAPVVPGPRTPGGRDAPVTPAAKTTDLPANVPPDVERALKHAGWSTITGTWVKKAENVYEVTDGKLETAKINGAVQVGIQDLGNGSVKVLVRNSHKSGTGISPKSSIYSTTTVTYGTGYGFSLEGAAATVFTPIIASGAGGLAAYRPYLDRKIPLADTAGTITALITIGDAGLELALQGKREHKSAYKVNKEGPFLIEVRGAATLAAPQAVGQ